MSSSSLSSSSFAKRTLGQPLCFCEVEATLRYSNNKRNPGRLFFGCPKFNTELPNCKYFNWAITCNQDIEPDVQERQNELLKKEKDLEKRLSDVLKMEIELRKRELVLLEGKAVLRHSRTLSKVYWDFVVLLCCYLVKW